MAKEARTYSEDSNNWNHYQRAVYTAFRAVLVTADTAAQALASVRDSETIYVIRQNLKDSNLDLATGAALLAAGATSKRSRLLGVGAGFLFGAGFKRYISGIDPRA